MRKLWFQMHPCFFKVSFCLWFESWMFQCFGGLYLPFNTWIQCCPKVEEVAFIKCATGNTGTTSNLDDRLNILQEQPQYKVAKNISCPTLLLSPKVGGSNRRVVCSTHWVFPVHTSIRSTRRRRRGHRLTHPPPPKTALLSKEGKKRQETEEHKKKASLHSLLLLPVHVLRW